MTTQAFLLQRYSSINVDHDFIHRIFQSSCEVFSTRRYGTCSVHPTVQQPARLERAIVSGGLRVRLRRDLDDRPCGCPLPAQGRQLLALVSMRSGRDSSTRSATSCFQSSKGDTFPGCTLRRGHLLLSAVVIYLLVTESRQVRTRATRSATRHAPPDPPSYLNRGLRFARTVRRDNSKPSS
jgi:hypothetical protein